MTTDTNIPVSNALFDVSEYKGGVVSDLFGEDRYFDNPETFWAAQNAAIAKAKEAYLADGWADVIVLDVGEYFATWEYADTDKDEGGKVYVNVARDGEVTFYEGQLSRKDIAARDKAARDGEMPAPQKPELTKPMQNYLDLHRNAAVRAELLSHPGVALRLAVAQIIAGSDLWTANADPQKANSEAIAESLASNKAEVVFGDERQAIIGLLELTDGDAETVVPRNGDWSATRDLHAIFARLAGLEDSDVTRILTFVVAECLPCGSTMVEALGDALNVDAAQSWTPDQVFFDLLRDKEAINAMLKDIGGKAVADGNVTSTGKVQKQIIQDYLNGTRKGGKADWHPRYLAVQMAAYTKRGGIKAIDQWKAVRKQYS